MLMIKIARIMFDKRSKTWSAPTNMWWFWVLFWEKEVEGCELSYPNIFCLTCLWMALSKCRFWVRCNCPEWTRQFTPEILRLKLQFHTNPLEFTMPTFWVRCFAMGELTNSPLKFQGWNCGLIRAQSSLPEPARRWVCLLVEQIDDFKLVKSSDWFYWVHLQV